MPHRRSLFWLPRLGLALGLAVSVSGCETLEGFNPFGEKDTKLSGDRTPVFPEGVPGLDYNAPRAQPSNANVGLSNQQPPAGGR